MIEIPQKSREKSFGRLDKFGARGGKFSSRGPELFFSAVTQNS